MRTQKERMIEEYAAQLEVPIIFRNDVHESKDSVELHWSDGKRFIYTIFLNPTVTNDYNVIQVNPKLERTIQSPEKQEVFKEAQTF